MGILNDPDFKKMSRKAFREAAKSAVAEIKRRQAIHKAILSGKRFTFNVNAGRK